MLNEHARRMSNEDYFRCLDQAATADRPEDVQRIRLEVLERWRGDPRADDLAEALYAHQERLNERASEPPTRGGRAGLRIRTARRGR